MAGNMGAKMETAWRGRSGTGESGGSADSGTGQRDMGGSRVVLRSTKDRGVYKSFNNRFCAEAYGDGFPSASVISLE
jgi:hypothetical protein